MWIILLHLLKDYSFSLTLDQQKNAYNHDEIGFNYRLPNLNAALLSAQIENLEIYFDAPITLAKKFSLRGVPTTIIFDKEGKEFARIIGSINFNDEEFIKWLKFYN